MYMCVSPDMRSATYQAARAAGIQRQSGTPASHRFSASDRANKAIAGQGAAFIMARICLRSSASAFLAAKRVLLEPLGYVMLREGPMIDAHRVTLSAPDDFEGWRDAARDLAEAGVPASAVVWQVEGGDADLFGSEAQQPAAASFPVPRGFVALAGDVVCHSDPERFALLYALLLRLKGNRNALDDEADPLVRRLQGLAKEVRRDIHKMHAFVR